MIDRFILNHIFELAEFNIRKRTRFNSIPFWKWLILHHPDLSLISLRLPLQTETFGAESLAELVSDFSFSFVSPFEWFTPACAGAWYDALFEYEHGGEPEAVLKKTEEDINLVLKAISTLQGGEGRG